MAAELVKFPERNIGDLPRMLRDLADSVEQGKYGDAHNLAWVIDCGHGKVEVGLMGAAAESGVTAHFLLALGMRKLEAI